MLGDGTVALLGLTPDLSYLRHSPGDQRLRFGVLFLVPRLTADEEAGATWLGWIDYHCRPDCRRVVEWLQDSRVRSRRNLEGSRYHSLMRARQEGFGSPSCQLVLLHSNLGWSSLHFCLAQRLFALLLRRQARELLPQWRLPQRRLPQRRAFVVTWEIPLHRWRGCLDLTLPLELAASVEGAPAPVVQLLVKAAARPWVVVATAA